jgi:ribosome maturation factor RimP
MIQAPVEAALHRAGYELVAMKLVQQGGALSVQIFIDHEDGLTGVTHGDCSRASRAILEEVDLDHHLSGRYVLEVSSPGIDRPLTRPAHYRRFRGEQALVRLAGEVNGQRVLRGTVGESDDEGVTLELEGGGQERVRFSDIASAQLKVDVWKASRTRESRPEGKSDPAC